MTVTTIDSVGGAAARGVTTSLTERLGKQFIVENRAGAGGTIGSELAANAPKDGYTLLIVSLAGAVNRWLYPLNYDPVKSFAPIASLVTTPAVVAVNPDVPAKSIKELVALAKAKPGGVQYASSGVGTFLHLAEEALQRDASLGALSELLAPEPLRAQVGEVLRLPLVLDHPSELARGGRAVEAEDLDR